MVVGLSLADVHLFIHGVGDLIFILIAAVTLRAVADRADNGIERALRLWHEGQIGQLRLDVHCVRDRWPRGYDGRTAGRRPR